MGGIVRREQGWGSLAICDRNKVVFYCTKKSRNYNNHKSPPYAQKKIIIKVRKERVEGRDKSTYLIALVLTPLSLIV
jgi:hypothetical protein